METIQLKCSSYNRDTNQTSNEQILGTYSSLKEFDVWASSLLGKYQLIEAFKEKGISVLNNSFYLTETAHRSIYYPIVYNAPAFQECLQHDLIPVRFHHSLNNYYIAKGIIYDTVDKKALGFQMLWRELEQKIDSFDQEYFDKLFMEEKNASRFKNLIYRVLSNAYDNELDRENDMRNLRNHFSIYNVVRKYIVLQQKLEKKNTFNVTRVFSKPSSPLKVDKRETKYTSNLDTNIKKDLTIVLYNEATETEEFFEPNELLMMNGTCDEEEFPTYKSR
ncbi:MAG: hypothetical protein PHN72_04555 [Bacilli bacterium]|nr:hypothetical protein [Bacilli bacterium]